MKALVADLLKENGWLVVGRLCFECTTAVARKVYVTAVAPKEAVVYLSRYEGRYFLTGGYESEGCNILSTVRTELNSDMTPEFIKQRVKTFSTEIDEEVDDSYARRLYLMGVTS
jgi:hypothetical protein